MNSDLSAAVLSDTDLRDLARAKRLLESSGLTAKISAVLGRPIEKSFQMLPQRWSDAVHRAVRSALQQALEVAVASLNDSPPARSSDLMHKMLVGASGGLGGALGLGALAVELPISTTLILRSIADIARDEGHDLDDLNVRLSCLEVFALGGETREDDAADSAYWAVRAAVSRAVAEAASFVAERGVLESGAPVIVRLVRLLSSRFGMAISKQAAVKAVPVLGAAGGSVINVLFMDHFQSMARGHFIVKRLERKYGTEPVRDVYNSIAVPI